MTRPATLLILIVISISTSAQQSKRAIAYRAGLSVNYSGEKSPHFTLPVGFGVSASLTQNKQAAVKPTIECTAVGFPEYVIHLSNNSSDDNKYAYGVFSMLAGSSIQIIQPFHIILVAGPSYHSTDKKILPGIKPAAAFISKDEKALFQLYYLKILKSDIMNGYVGLSVHYKFR